MSVYLRPDLARQPQANPFDQFDAPAAPAAANPFDQFDTSADAWTPPPAPPGEIIHGAAGDYMSDRPDMTARRPSNSGADPAQSIEELALRKRYANDFDKLRGVLPFFQGDSANLGDEVVSAMNGARAAISGAPYGLNYDVAHAAMQQALDRQRMEHPVASTIEELAGAGLLGASTAGTGLTATGAKMGEGLLPRIGAGMVDGAAMGGLYGAGAGSGLEDRVKGGVLGAVTGGVVGGAIPPLVAGGKKVLDAVLARLPGGAARTADAELAQAAVRSGKSQDDVVQALADAQADGQPQFTLGDALGNPGQRLLSTAARTPNDDRAALIEFLNQRQAGAGRRVAGALQDASGTQETAAQTAARLEAERGAAADADYDALRAATEGQPVWSQELQDLTSRPSVRAAIGDARKIGAERGYQVTNPFKAAEDGTLSLPEGTTPNFQFWDTVKRGIDKQIAANPTDRDLVATKNLLTKILDKEVPDYAAARAPFAAKSKAIEAIDTGKNAAMRGRIEDTIPAFQSLSPEEQAAFRSGYFDPLIADAQKGAEGVNKARPLLTDATKAEFPAFAAPGEGDKLAARLGREKTMFETRAEATGGSKTADNLADQGSFGTADLDLVGNLLQSSVKNSQASDCA